MDTQVLSVNNFEVKKEKIESPERQITFPDQLSQLKNLANTIEEGFQYHFIDLEEYLARLLEEQNYEYSPGLGEEEKISMAKAKAKEYFKNYANEVFRNLKQTVEKEQLHHILPQSYVDGLINNLKRNIESSLQILSEEIIEGIIRQDTSSIDDGSKKIQKVKKGKSKIPKKALTILRNWLTEHFQDPYPSHTEKLALAKQAGIDFKQVQNWFTNARGRVWKKSYNPEKFSSQIKDVLVEKVVKPKVEVQEVKNNFNNNMSYIPYINYPMAKPMMSSAMQPTYILAPQYR
jgi:predicted transcriptional regulator